MAPVSVCIEMVYDDEPFHERVRRAAETGAHGVEFWGWRDKDLERIRSRAAEHDVSLVACGAGGVLTDPDGVDQAVATVRESIRMAATHGIDTLICTTGPEQEVHERDVQHDAIVEVLTQAASDAEAAGVTLALEPLNTAVDHPGYYLTESAEGFRIVDAVGSANVKLLFDVYHQQVTEGNIIATIEANVDRIGHLHLADVPGRHEPGTGELAYENVLQAVDEAGYDGYVGCEFSPIGDPDAAINDVLSMAR